MEKLAMTHCHQARTLLDSSGSPANHLHQAVIHSIAPIGQSESQTPMLLFPPFSFDCYDIHELQSTRAQFVPEWLRLSVCTVYNIQSHLKVCSNKLTCFNFFI
eukprot:gb/GECG01002787.1/.p1 GENE.gb/GECG01002787.1/~~gb/GECG01002787.1/.p1  ORF type:complete len:103 (+),score=4.79 gb/GECG01002787.1/:1-309(+)